MTGSISLEKHVLGSPEAKGTLLLIIPAYNESGCIAEVVGRARATLPSTDVLVIDDGSSDNTAEIAERAGAFAVSHPFNLGIGGTVQTGLKFARKLGYEYVARIDGDGQHDPQELLRLLAPVQEGLVDVAVGSRFLADKVTMEIPLARRLGIQLFAREVSLITGHRATDTTSGMTVMNRKAVQVLASQMPQDYPEVESRVILHGAGLKIMEIPVHMGERLAGSSSINSWRSIYYALKVSIAVLLTAMKEAPKFAKTPMEVPHYAEHSGSHGNNSQPGSAASHHSAGTQTQTA
jgi:glycosyltransferase involved in cell wall biosynthesis